MTLFFPLTIAIGLAAQAPTDKLALDFRGGQFRETVLGYFGPNAKSLIKGEADGLRITIPSGAQVVQPTGFFSKLAVHGDFEITLTYELLYCEKPKAGHGSGVRLAVFVASPTKESAVVARAVHPVNGDVYITNRSTKPPDGTYKLSPELFATASSGGQLRLVRKGSTLVYLAAEPGMVGFRELRREEFLDLPLSTIRVTGDTGQALSELDIRILKLEIVSGELDSSQPTSVVQDSALWTAAVAFCVVTVLVVLYFTWHRSRNVGFL